MRSKDRGGPARPVGDLLGGVLKSLGVASRAQARRVREAWARAADPAWAGRAAPVSLRDGVLLVSVSSAPLREELTHFHAERLLRALQASLPAEHLSSLRFVAGAETP